MQNQDPLNPMDNAQVTTQMAAINTVQGIQGLETTLTSLLSTFNATQSVQATNLVGQNVLAPGSALNLSGGSASGGVSLAAKADNVVVSVLNSSQQVVQSMNLGAESAGTLSFNWDGTSNSGAKLPDGAYTFSVSASAAGQPVTATTLANGKVTGVDPSSSGANVSVGSLGTFSLSQISQIQ
jgi:flagellar basal-body rod modification protein FlgD